MSRKAYKSWIPADAVETVTERYPDGTKKESSYFVGDEEVGYRMWDDAGRLDYESARSGPCKGSYYGFHANGQLSEVQPYRNGMMHGIGKQWSEDGELLVSWKLVNNVGLDLWCCTWTKTLAEERYWPADGELGYLRQWNEDETTVWEEYFYVRGTGYHGIWREWNAKGRLRRGFPQYFIADRKVTRRQYLRACKSDPMLRPYRVEDDDPRRELPSAYLAHKARRLKDRQ